MLELLTRGGVMMIPIGLCSVMALAIVLERFWTLRRNRVIPPRAIQQVELMVRHGDLNGAQSYCRKSRTAFGAIVLSGLKNAGERRGVIKEGLEEAGRQEIIQLERYLNFLGTIAQITPLLGLLGTVIGMITVFSVVSDVGVGNPTVLAGGISEALTTTAAGLFVAIPSLALYRYFNRVIDRYVVELEQFALMIVEHIKSGH
ncbi:MAG: MotA/TolQ/ExbB proton channel family protein [Magnetococcales bacterium]|nr:MotA/TolQ/ExbB proton channel family protein [Magnetococcales bacterium]